MKRDILGLVLCGGKSSRMGFDKGEIELEPGISLLERQLRLLAPFCRSLAVGVGPEGRKERKLTASVVAVHDIEGMEGPMAGVIAALRLARGKAVLAIACDMPFLQEGDLLLLLSRRNPERLASAFVASDGAPDPMCAIYEASALSELEQAAASGKLSLRRFLKGSEVELLQAPNPTIMASVNDPKALLEARVRISSELESRGSDPS
ncbi:molybdenum cofactor guanylyltransferase [Pelagicoccus sp. SDUM812002]|uniref:molybdenum cofactor guanylyltransferase n=1 Tax=Pelagicoccus sp. SDUM812002 TaxID=3041266 RepID=UPI00280C6C95|nr:molybdenum cofactor guanylyltransferase [Pelagicoccus sp. SDUM812002]MDQ8186178.1 molybdenum cofactor guanylyltransferase [Pelagicoccus sp. SDUM812002]